MSCSLFITTSWNTRGKAAKSLKAFSQYTSHAPITVFQNGGSPVCMESWLKEETGVSNFQFMNTEKPVKHGTMWEWCMNNSMHEWNIIVSDLHYPTEDMWDLHFDTITRWNPHDMYFLGHFASSDSFAISKSSWQKLGFHRQINSPVVQLYNIFLKLGHMYNVPEKEEIYRKFVFHYANTYLEPLFETEHVIDLPVDKEELAFVWQESDNQGTIQGPDGIWRKPYTPDGK
jgi:hypothetical protein